MYLRTVKARGSKGVQHEYVRLVESYRENGKNKQRVVCNLGRKDLLVDHLPALVRLLGGEPSRVRWVDGDQLEAVGAWDWGPMLVARSLWVELGLDQILQRQTGRGRVDAQTLSDRALVLVTNRLCQPTSEHGLARWLETDFVCDRAGRRWLPQWRDDDVRKRSRTPRVRVELSQLKQWYRTLDQLKAGKERIEKQLYLQLRDLFSLKVDLALYDITSTYFEGKTCTPLKQHGYSRDGKPRQRQVVFGCVLVDGWPIAHHIFAGNTRDAKTVPTVITDLQQRFGLRRVVFVGDRGMMTSDNVAHLRDQGQGYLLGRNRRRSEEIFRYIEQANQTDQWVSCPVGITAGERTHPPQTLVQEVNSDQPGIRIFVVKSEERLSYERGQRQKAMARLRKDFEKLEQRIASGRLKAEEKIGAAAERILGRHHGSRYFGWELKQGAFRFFEHPVHLQREQAYEGTYVIQTEEQDITPVEAVSLYKQLDQVERAFRSLKDVIDMRPIFHQTDERIEAHLFVAALAFLLHRAIDTKLHAAGLDLSATEALQALRTIRVVDIDLGHGRSKRSVTAGSNRAAAILHALRITHRNPPDAPQQTPHRYV